jgi:hypothetical protein
LEFLFSAGGAPIGCYVHELLKYKGMWSCGSAIWLNFCKGVPTDHIAIRTSRFTGIEESNEEVIVHNLSYLKETAKGE